jgi:ATP sulfurylase
MTLQESLQLLVNSILAETGQSDIELELTLPKAVLDACTKIYYPKERIILAGEERPSIAAFYLNGGIVRFKTI